MADPQRCASLFINYCFSIYHQNAWTSLPTYFLSKRMRTRITQRRKTPRRTSAARTEIREDAAFVGWERKLSRVPSVTLPITKIAMNLPWETSPGRCEWLLPWRSPLKCHGDQLDVVCDFVEHFQYISQPKMTHQGSHTRGGMGSSEKDLHSSCLQNKS